MCSPAFLCTAVPIRIPKTATPPLQVAGTPFPWRQQEQLLWAPLRMQAAAGMAQQRWLSGGSGVRCAAAAASQALAPDPGNGALMRVIDTELRTEAEQSYLAVRLPS